VFCAEEHKFVPKEIQILNGTTAIKDQLQAMIDEPQRKKLLKEHGKKQLEYDLGMEHYKRKKRV
jgi:hypothetical protein